MKTLLLFLLGFYCGGCFVLAVTIHDATRNFTVENLLQVASWPLVFVAYLWSLL